MTSPVISAAVSLIVPDHRRDEFREWDSIREKSVLRIGFSGDPDAAAAIAQALPQATPIPYRDKKEVDSLLAKGAPGFDAILDSAEEAAAWTIRHPTFTAVIPSPPMLVPLGYAVAKGDADLLAYFDTWLLNAESDGTIDALYRYWMLGQVKETQPPRWSVIRNVLGWID